MHFLNNTKINTILLIAIFNLSLCIEINVYLLKTIMNYRLSHAYIYFSEKPFKWLSRIYQPNLKILPSQPFNLFHTNTLVKGIQNSTCWQWPYTNKIEFLLNCVYQPKLPYVWMLRVSGFRADEICSPPFCVYSKKFYFILKLEIFSHTTICYLICLSLNGCYNLKMFLISCKQYTYIHRYSYISFTITIRLLHCYGNSTYSFRVLTWESCLRLIRFHFI